VLLIKRLNQKALCFLVYIRREVDEILLRVSKHWIDGMFQFNTERDETGFFLETVRKVLERF